MAGLDPAIHVFAKQEGVDVRHKAGHDNEDHYLDMVGLTGSQRWIPAFAGMTGGDVETPR
jgi:hypothetical protein